MDAGLGKPGALQPDGAYKVGLPRGDLHVMLAGVAIKPTLALGSWVAFQQVSDTDAMLMGDLVLLESEIAPVLRQLQEGGIEQTALHNHLVHESPRVMYLHVAGRGMNESPRLLFMHYGANDGALKLARGLRAALDRMNVKKPS